MPANSPLRRAAKRWLVRTTSERVYAAIQALVMATDMRRGRLWEPELALLSWAVREGEVAIDIGANYGLYTYHLSRAVGSSGIVYAFEPIPFTHRSLRLVALMLRLHNVKIFAKAAAERDGPCVFTVPVQESGAIAAGLAHIRSGLVGDAAVPGCITTCEIAGETVALDGFLPPLRELSLIKCDIEGAELLAFKGCARTLETHLPTVLCEIDDGFLKRFGIRREELLSFFAVRGYRAFVWHDDGLRDLPDAAEPANGNVVFIHPTRLERMQPLLRETMRGAGPVSD